MKNTAVVLRLGYAGLAVARALGRAGIPVIGLDWTPDNVGCVSRYCRFELCPQPDQPERLLEFLTALGRRLEAPGVLMLASDHVVAFASQYRQELQKHFLLNVPDQAVAEAMINKLKQCQLAASLGIPHPKYFLIETMADLTSLQDRGEYPALIKPLFSHEWRRHFPVKAFTVHDFEQVRHYYKKIFPLGLKTMVQALIPGPTTNLHVACAYIPGDSRVLGSYTLRKIRQFPVDFGQASLAVTTSNPEVSELALRFALGSGFRGAFMVEFKYDQRDGNWKLMELNPRYWTHTYLGPDCGVNLPMLHYLDLTGQSPEPITTFQTGMHWLDSVKDARAFWTYWKHNELSALGWAKSLKGVSSHAAFAPDDLRPFLRHLVPLPLLLWGKIRTAARVHKTDADS